ncbi:hypothetical protein C7S13_4640 [Burkholderia cepacia]|nr:hypothetical protein [Burkholderia cepacia]
MPQQLSTISKWEQSLMCLIYMDFFALLPFRDTLFLGFLASMALSYSPIRNK